MIDLLKTKATLKHRILSCRKEFHALLTALSRSDLKEKSHNPGWTNGEILFHMLLGFIVVSILFPMVKAFSLLPASFSKVFSAILNFSTPVFNFLNAIGARIGGRIFSLNKLDHLFDRVTGDLVRKIDSLDQSAWESGMHFPDRWDGLFDKFMNMEKLFNYPVAHFKFHLKQIKRKTIQKKMLKGNPRS